MSALPKFDLSSMTLKSDDDLKDLTKSSASPFFKPGRHEVQITRSTYKGFASDENWGKVEVEMTGAGGQTIRDTVLVPFKDLGIYRAKDGKNTTFPARKLTNFLQSIGQTVSVTTLGQVLPRLFAKDNALVGLNVAIECAFKGNHTKRQGDEIVIVDRNGNRLVDQAFADYKDANEYAKANNLELAGFVDVVRYALSSAANKTADTNW